MQDNPEYLYIDDFAGWLSGEADKPSTSLILLAGRIMYAYALMALTTVSAECQSDVCPVRDNEDAQLAAASCRTLLDGIEDAVKLFDAHADSLIHSMIKPTGKGITELARLLFPSLKGSRWKKEGH